MGDVKASIKKDGDKKVLVLELPWSAKGTPSKSGKSNVHASTGGNQTTELDVDGKKLVVGINAYTKLD
jgi:hypothetical protein